MSGPHDVEDDASDEYDRAIQAVAAAAAECRRQMGEAADPVGDAIIILRGVIRDAFPGQNGDDIAELACLGVVIGVCHRGAQAAAGVNAALEASGLPWRLVGIAPDGAQP